MQSRNRDIDIEKKYTDKRENRDGRKWETGIDIYTLLILYTEQVTNEKLLYSTGNSVLWADLKVREIQKGGNICIRMADSLCCTTETNTIL